MTRLEISSQITFFYTDDLDGTHLFYHHIMGFPLTLDQGSCRIYQVTESGYIGFCIKKNFGEVEDGSIFTIVTSDVDAWYNKLSSQGVKFIKKPEINEKYQIYQCLFRDPNGYLIEVQSFLDPRWK